MTERSDDPALASLGSSRIQAEQQKPLAFEDVLEWKESLADRFRDGVNKVSITKFLRYPFPANQNP